MSKVKWTTVRLTKRQLCFLDKISKGCKFSGGRRFSRTSILRAFLRAGKRLDVNVDGIKTEGDLKRRVVAAFKSIY